MFRVLAFATLAQWVYHEKNVLVQGSSGIPEEQNM